MHGNICKGYDEEWDLSYVNLQAGQWTAEDMIRPVCVCVNASVSLCKLQGNFIYRHIPQGGGGEMCLENVFEKEKQASAV